MEINLLNKFQKVYKAKLYIQRDYIVFQVESDLGKFSKQFTLEQLQNLDRYFRQSENLDDGINDIKYLFENKYSIDENEDFINITMNNRGKEIKFVLDKVNEEGNIFYNSLSDRMKDIINKNELILGIDLGTTYSCAAVMIDNNIVMIRNSLGLTTTPSYISFLNRNEVYVGELAKLLPSNKNVIFNTKRLLGKSIEDKEIKEIKQKLPFNLKKDEQYNLLKIVMSFEDEKEEENEINLKSEEEFYPEQICALILKKIVKDAEFYLSKKLFNNNKKENKEENQINIEEPKEEKKIKINNVVITVPAYFNQKQREATLNAAKIIGLNVKTMINEPTAASLAYAYKSLENVDKKLIVIDFGGGTLDITLLRYKKNNTGVYCDVKFTYGDTHFGGEDFDNIIMEKCKADYNKLSKKEFNESHSLRLKRACERAKIRLSSSESTNIHIEDNYDVYDLTITRNEFLELCKNKFAEFKNLLKDFIKQSKINIKDISEVILIGGTNLIPNVRQIIKDTFKYSIIQSDLDPKEVVAMGAAIRAAKFSNLPCVEEIALFDVTNLSLGIREYGNKLKIIIPRSTKIPYLNIGKFETSMKDQTIASIEVYEGEEEKNCNQNNLLLGKFQINLPAKKKGEVKVDVQFDITDNSILKVTATEKSNPLNKKDLVIERLNDFSDKIDNLKERDSEIFFFENKDYNEIKFSIIEFEEEINKQKNKNNINEETLKSTYKKKLDTIGDFLVKYNSPSDIYISFVKYYFNIICEFYAAYNFENQELKQLQEKITILLEKVNCYNKNLIFEIVEESVGISHIYRSFVVNIIITGLWDDINTIFFSIKSSLKSNDKATILQAKEELFKTHALIDVCLKLIDKYDEKKIKLNNITKGDLKNLNLKITVREEILKNKDIFYYDISLLKELYNKYYQCPSLDPDDLQELGRLIGIVGRNQENPENYNEDIERASTFIQWLQHKNENDEDDDIYHTITQILTSYPYNNNYNERGKIKDEFYKFKKGECSKNDYLLNLKRKYQNKRDSGQLSDIELNVFNTILAYFNRLEID